VRETTQETTAGRDEVAEATPELLPPQPLVARPPFIAGAALASCLALGAAAFLTFGDHPLFGPSPSGFSQDHTDPDKGNGVVITLAADKVPGAFSVLPADFHNSPDSVIGQMHLAEAEKRRLSERLLDGSVRLAAVTLWDNVAEDGDVVEVSAATFSQTLQIMHKPQMFFVPIQPGGSVLIKAIRDGGGGVTLGVRTIIGPVPLPPLAVGQMVEIPAL
jgi:hypothetical protein